MGEGGSLMCIRYLDWPLISAPQGRDRTRSGGMGAWQGRDRVEQYWDRVQTQTDLHFTDASVVNID